MNVESIRAMKRRMKALLKVMPFKKYTYQFIEEMVYDVIFCLNCLTHNNKNNKEEHNSHI